MLRLTSILFVFSILHLSQSTTIDFSAVFTCDLPARNWCMRVFYLEKDHSDYDLLGKSDVRCFMGNGTSSFSYQHYLRELDSLTFEYEIEIGVRHSCTCNGYLMDWVAKEQVVDCRATYDTVETKADIHDKGNHVFGVNLDWDSNRFQDFKFAGF